MASEYLKWKYRDVKPEAPRVLTPKERRANWWDYHKWHVLLGLALMFALADLLVHVLGIGQIEPDYQFAYVGSRLLPDGAAAAFETALAALGEDANGDGQVVVRLNQYADGADAEDPDAALYAYASSTRLMADLERGDSAFFLLEDPARFQRNYEVVTGGTPLLWADCPALAALPLGDYEEGLPGQTVRGDSQSLFAGLYLARRGWEEPSARAERYEALWDRLTEGAVP